MTMAELISLLDANCKARGLNSFDTLVYTQEIKNAIAEINRCRRFTPTEGRPYDKKYEDLIIPLCISSLAKIGAEGQTAHNENNVNRVYENGGNYPSSITKSITPLIK